MSELRFRLRRPTSPRSVADYRAAARRRVPSMVWIVAEGGADAEQTLAGNRAAFDRYQLRQRLLTGAVPTSLATEVAGTRLELPVIVAPFGMQGMFHSHGEVATATGAERAGTRHILSTASSYSLEEVAAATTADHWFQLYPWGDRELIGGLIGRAKAAGYGALFVTVDVPTGGNRLREQARGMSRPPVITPGYALQAMAHPRWAAGFLARRRVSMANLAPTPTAGRGRAGGRATGLAAGARAVARHTDLMLPTTWDELAWMRDQWSGPMFLKGVTEADDAARAIDLGLSGVVVSNHGGRQLDGIRPTLAALPEIVAAVGDRAQVLLDSGVRTGTDVIKAIALGARACLIGRAAAYGLMARGCAGVTGVLEILRAEITRTLTLMGLSRLDQLTPDHLRRTFSDAP